MKGIYLTENAGFIDRVYSKETQEKIATLVDMSAGWANREKVLADKESYADIDVVLSTWSCPRFDEELLDVFKSLKIVLYGAGSLKAVVTDAFWERGVRVCSAWAANAVPVAHFTVAQILFSLKLGWFFMDNFKKTKKGGIQNDNVERIVYGTYKSTVGIISLGMIGRMVAQLLKPFDLNILAYDPFITQVMADEIGLNVKMCSLEEIFSQSDVVSLHTPLLPETVGMIEGRHFEMMKPSTTFINTSRGAIIKEDEMIEVLKKRPDLYACLDVTYPEPPRDDSPLYELPNVILTPHVAGSVGRECTRMGDYMLSELEKFLNEEKLDWEIDKQKFAIMA